MGRGGNRDGAPTARIRTTRRRRVFETARRRRGFGTARDTAGDVAGGADRDLRRAGRLVLDLDTDLGRSKHPKTDHASAPPSTTTTISIKKSKTITGIYGNGSSITGNSRSRHQHRPGPRPSRDVGHPGGDIDHRRRWRPHDDDAGIDPNIAAMTGPAPGSATSPAPVLGHQDRPGPAPPLWSPTISKFRPQSSLVGATVVIFGKRLSMRLGGVRRHPGDDQLQQLDENQGRGPDRSHDRAHQCRHRRRVCHGVGVRRRLSCLVTAPSGVMSPSEAVKSSSHSAGRCFRAR